MSATERAETLSELYRLQSHIGVLRQRAQAARSLCLSVPLERMMDGCNEAIAEFVPDSPVPTHTEFPRRKY